VETLLQVSMRQPDAIVYSDFWLFGAMPGGKPSDYQLDDYNFIDLLGKNLMPATALFPREAWVKSGGFKEVFSQLGGWEDYEFWINLGKMGHCGHHVREPLWGYRQHADSMRKGALRNKREIQAEIMRIHQDVYRGEFPMGCCGKGSRTVKSARDNRAAPASTVASNPASSQALGSSPLVQVTYTGGKAGRFSVNGRVTGAVYNFSALQNTKWVDPRDYEAGFGGHFVMVQREVPRPTPVAAPNLTVVEAPVAKAEPVKPKPEMPAADFTKLKGVGPSTDDALRKMGLRTLEDLAFADPEEVAEAVRVPGDRIGKIKGWQEEAITANKLIFAHAKHG